MAISLDGSWISQNWLDTGAAPLEGAGLSDLRALAQRALSADGALER